MKESKIHGMEITKSQTATENSIWYYSISQTVLNTVKLKEEPKSSRAEVYISSMKRQLVKPERFSTPSSLMTSDTDRYLPYTHKESTL